jgi:DNA polymerase III epsilon subunit-like protein
MVVDSPSEPLSQLEVLVVDCQDTTAAPRGHLLEIGWARVRGMTITHARASLIALPDGERIPSAIARITGISGHMMRSAVDGRCAWRELTDQASSLTQRLAPTVIHFARFEQPFLRTRSRSARHESLSQFFAPKFLLPTQLHFVFASASYYCGYRLAIA